MSRRRSGGRRGKYARYLAQHQDMQDDMNGDDDNPSDVQVKLEIDEAEGETTYLESDMIPAYPVRNVAPPQPKMATTQSAAQWTGSKSKVRTQLRNILEDKSVDSMTAVQNVNSVIDDLVKKNEYLLSLNDTLGYKPHSRRGRPPGEAGRSRDVVFPGRGQSATFSAGQNIQGRVTASATHSSSHVPVGSSDALTALHMGQLLRPKSPTRRCHVLEKDKTHLHLALMETKAGCQEGEKIFRVKEHEVVCAIAAETKFVNNGKLVSSVDIKYFWCNFCPFSTTSKSLLMQHVIDHRFHCKFCRYQSFSRADVVHHSVHNHPQFADSAVKIDYCTFLPDYLRIQNFNEKCVDNRPKRRRDDEDDDDEEPSRKIAHADYDSYDVNVEELDDTAGEEEAAIALQELRSKSSSASSSSTAVSGQPETLPNTMTPIPVIPAVSMNSSSGGSSPGPDNTQPVISQVYSASDVPPSMAPAASSSLPIQYRSTSPGTVPQPSASTSALCQPVNPNSVGAGSMQQMRNSLYWSCGYCPFTSASQSEIKRHSVQEHSRRPYRYVAMIKSEECSAASAEEESSDQNVDVEATGEEQEEPSGGQEDPPVLIKQEPVEEEESNAPIKVRFPTPRLQHKDNTSLQCYHCLYTSRLLGPLRNHILNKHPGLCLVGLGGKGKVFMCPRLDCTFRSSSCQTFLTHASECTHWKGIDATEEPDPLVLECLQATSLIAQQVLAETTAIQSSDATMSTPPAEPSQQVVSVGDNSH